jgi:hypothetical protein
LSSGCGSPSECLAAVDVVVWPSGVGFGVCAASRTRTGTLRLLGDWLSLSEFHRPASELGAASASTTHTFVHRFLWKTRALQAEHAEHCAALLTTFSPKQETGFWAPLMGFFKDRPSVDITLRLPHPPKWCTKCQPRTRTVRAVLPGFDGLLSSELCGLVASRCRPWGSLGFEPVVDRRSGRFAKLSSRTPTLQSFSLHFEPNPVTPTLLPGSPRPVPLSPLFSNTPEGMSKTQSQGLDPCGVRCCPAVLPRPAGPMLSWASSTLGSRPRSRDCSLCVLRHRNDEAPAMQAPLLTLQPSETSACANIP